MTVVYDISNRVLLLCDQRMLEGFPIDHETQSIREIEAENSKEIKEMIGYERQKEAREKSK